MKLQPASLCGKDDHLMHPPDQEIEWKKHSIDSLFPSIPLFHFPGSFYASFPGLFKNSDKILNPWIHVVFQGNNPLNKYGNSDH